MVLIDAEIVDWYYGDKKLSAVAAKMVRMCLYDN
jgi:hypothetical protein